MEIKPLYLLADSQLLFVEQGRNGFTQRLKEDLPADPKAAYIGASNNHHTEFYDLFLAAMELIGIKQCRMVPEQLADDAARFWTKPVWSCFLEVIRNAAGEFLCKTA